MTHRLVAALRPPSTADRSGSTTMRRLVVFFLLDPCRVGMLLLVPSDAPTLTTGSNLYVSNHLIPAVLKHFSLRLE
jgi:hypothetical protein